MVIKSQAGFDFSQFPAHSPFQAFQIGSGTKWRALSPLSERQVQPTHTAYKKIMVLNISSSCKKCAIFVLVNL